MLFVLVVVALATMGQATRRSPWAQRRRPGREANLLLSERVLESDWPREPSTPRNIDEARFAAALRTLCHGMPPARSARYASWILADAAQFDVDPFLLAALMHRETRCLPDAADVEGPGIGLTQIHWDIYRSNVEHGVLSFLTRDGAHTADRALRIDRFPFGPMRIAQAEANLYFAAALLAMWKAQHSLVDEAFEQASHRSEVSHFVWGDRVRSDVHEERILTDRRRLLEYYEGHALADTVAYRGVDFGCPLDGCPRVVLSWLGAERADGSRSHRGIDLDSVPDEPVRAMADGVVTFAGVDLPGNAAHVQLRTPAEYAQHPRASLGAGGRYVCVRHRSEATLVTCYMHLEEVDVHYGMRVTRGDRLGTVGRTGMQASAAHLHLELHRDRLDDPSVAFAGLLLGRRGRGER